MYSGCLVYEIILHNINHYTDYFGTKESMLLADHYDYQGSILGQKSQDGPLFQNGTEGTVIDLKNIDDHTIILFLL